jgi:hypothetical protein
MLSHCGNVMIRWSDRDAIYAAVSTALDKIERDRAREVWVTYWTEQGWSFEEQRWTTHRSLKEIAREREQIAIAEARAGDPHELFEFLRPENGDLRAKLAPETWELMFDCAHRISPFKRKRGQPQSEERRRARFPIHNAVALVPVIERILIELFPGRTEKAIRDSAQECAERRSGLRAGAIADHSKRPKKRRLLTAAN